MYRLEAIIASDPTLRSLAISGAHIVPLDQGLSLLPMTDALFSAITGDAKLDGFWKAPTGLGDVLAACPGPVAYIEAEFFGGDGMQSAQVWHDGEVVLGPLHQPEGEPPDEAGSPISQALQHLGVSRGDHFDEFDAVGLDRHRETEDWLD
ncbi:hypothetical protein [Actinocrispum sp. NPDC049592]|uniref:hypothetical protein n=1 Tax=Actinocrispum sp. NPDC049592 TaxID=3154835 RepID=UPI00342A16EA